MKARLHVGVLLAAVACPLGAQQDAAPHDAAVPLPTIPVDPRDEVPPPTEVPRFDDLVVTADKRESYSRDLPASVAALGGKDLERAGAAEMRDFLRSIPGIGLTEAQPDLFRISIRGIQADVSAVTPQTEGVFLDDVPLNDPFITQVRPDVPLFDLERIEVLKGPQGTLFGGSGLAGALRYQLADAVPGLFELKSYLQYQQVSDGSPNRIGGAALNVPLGRQAAVRFVGVRRLTGGVIDDVRNDLTDTDRTDNYSARGLLRWIPSDDWSVGFKAYEQRTSAEDLPWAETTDGDLERGGRLQKSPSLSRFQVYGLDLRHGLSWAEVAAVTSASRKFSDFENAYGERAMGTEDSGEPVSYPTKADIEGIAQEVRLASLPHSDWQWLIGAFAQDYASVSLQRVVSPSPLAIGPTTSPSLLDFAADVTATELAVFGEASVQLGGRWRATMGLRGYSVETEGTVVSSGPIILATGETENRNDAAVKVRGVNPKGALQYALTDELRAYLGVARGFRFGGIQIVGPSPANPDVPETYTSDSLWSYELGMRSEWLEGALQADGAVFYLDWKDPQVQTTTGGAVALNLIDNAESARSYGVELLLRYLTPLPGLRLDLSGAYTDARITAPYTAPSGATVPSGARLPGYSKVQVAGTLDYQRALGPLVMTATLQHAYLGPGSSDILQSMEIYDYASTDVRLAITHPSLTVAPTLSVSLANLRDERAIVSAFVNAEDNVFTVYNRPRTLDVRLDLRF